MGRTFAHSYSELQLDSDPRHYGNMSLLLQDDDWVLAPAYDMLPMLYAQVGGELVARNFADRPLFAYGDPAKFPDRKLRPHPQHPRHPSP